MGKAVNTARMGKIQRDLEEIEFRPKSIVTMKAEISLEEFHATGEGEVKGSIETFGHTTDAGSETISGTVSRLENLTTGETYDGSAAVEEARDLAEMDPVFSDQRDIDTFLWVVDDPDDGRIEWLATYDLDI